MISALFYLQYHLFKNRTLQRIKRLKQPKYLSGAIVGGIYLYFYAFRYYFGFGSGRTPLMMPAAAQNAVLYESVGASILFVIVLLAWVVPHERAALAFSEAEVAFLFPAPIDRRGLIHFKLLRSQTAILFTTILLTLVLNRLAGHPWIRAAGWWLILSTLNLHFLGCSFARTMLLEHGISNWTRRGVALALVIGLGVVVAVWARKTLPPFDMDQLGDLAALKDYFQQLLSSGPIPYLLYPFRLVVRPYLAQSAMGFLTVAWPALTLMLLHYLWVIRSNVAFEEASVEASRKLAEKVAAVRAGNWQTAGRKPKSKRAPFKLRSSGFPSTALLWKNLISAGQAFTLRIWISVAAVAIGGSVGLRQSSAGSGWLMGVGMFAAMLMVWSLLIGPQVLRHDFRQDLPLCDVLKLYPLRGWQVALGELLAPVVILTGIQWFLVILSAGLWSHAKAGSATFAVGLGLGAALVLPVLNLILLVIPNAAVLLFPAWFQAGKEGAQSIEATGQRLIFLLGQLLVFFIALIPAAALFVAVFFLVKIFLLDAPALELVLASVAATLVLAAEAMGGVLLLGWLFERFDVSAEN
jgi:hypothetical protein